MSLCCACSTQLPVLGLDLGVFPLSHDLSLLADSNENFSRKIPFHLVQCPRCALAQTLESPRPESLLPREEWVRFSEPELHLDDLAEQILALRDFSSGSSLGGLSSKDDSLLERFSTKGIQNIWRIDPENDVGFSGNSAGVAWIQEALNSSLAGRIRRDRGRSDLLIARHFLEHVPNIGVFSEAARELLNPGGLFLVEVPDCGQGLEIGDVSILWEEHHICFTSATLERSLILSGFDILLRHKYRLPNETCLVVVATPRRAGDSNSSQPTSPSACEFDFLNSYVSQFPIRRLFLRNLLETWRAVGPIAIYGAGHHTNTFIHALGIHDLIALVIDDNPHKTGRFIPGSAIPVFPSGSLKFPEVAVCLSSLGFAAEQRMLSTNTPFSDAGGSFYSIFPEQAGTPLRWLAGKKMPS